MALASHAEKHAKGKAMVADMLLRAGRFLAQVCARWRGAAPSEEGCPPGGPPCPLRGGGGCGRGDVWYGTTKLYHSLPFLVANRPIFKAFWDFPWAKTRHQGLKMGLKTLV